MELLLAKGEVDPNSKDNGGRTPLSRAAEKGRGAVVALLLAKGRVDPDSKDSESRTPLALAAGSGYKEVVELLLAKDNYSRTLLSRAAANGHKEVVELLLTKSGVDPNSGDSDYRGPSLQWIIKIMVRSPLCRSYSGVLSFFAVLLRSKGLLLYSRSLSGNVGR